MIVMKAVTKHSRPSFQDDHRSLMSAEPDHGAVDVLVTAVGPTTDV